ncbi:MAG: NFACT RNA binding domain-containing protein, partial [Bacilli bacterium]|nr:NFACT RNA binding domain-containing protein [Bacilli bacterium]
ILNYSCFKDENNNQYYVGKNALQNNYLSFKLAQPHDLWLHIKDLSGAHVIIKSNDINDDILLKGARLALAFSKATINNNYEVQYTLVKNLKKIKGQLGRVSFTTHQSIIVLNDQQILKELEQIK